MPDQSSPGCAGRCGSNSQTVNNLFSVSSHELAETLTDPAIGINIMSWYYVGLNPFDVFSTFY